MGDLRKKLSKYLVEIKKVRGKLFFSDLFAFVNKKNPKKLSGKLVKMQNLIGDTSCDEQNYRKSIENELKTFKFEKEKIPENISKIIHHINDDLNAVDDNVPIGDDKKIIFSEGLDIVRCLKNIRKDIKSLKRHTSWFFQKDNAAKILFKLSSEVVDSIEKNMGDENKKMNIDSIHSDLISVEGYILDALKMRMMEKNLHDSDSDDVRSILVSLYSDFGYLSKIMFNEGFKELPGTFVGLADSEGNENESLNHKKSYYVSLIDSDLRKLYKKTSSMFSKDNEAKKLYNELGKEFSKLKKNLSDTNLDTETIKSDLIRGGECVCKYVEQRSTRLKNANRSTSKDETLRIMYNLYNDYDNFVQVFGGKLQKKLDRDDDYSKVDENTKGYYYKINFSPELSKLFGIDSLLKDFNKYEGINDLLKVYNEKNYFGRGKGLKDKFDDVQKSFLSFKKIIFVDDEGNVSTEGFDKWSEDFSNKIDLYVDYVKKWVNFATLEKGIQKEDDLVTEDKRKKLNKERESELEVKQKDIKDKIEKMRDIIKDEKNRDIFLKDHKSGFKDFRKVNDKNLLLRANHTKILGAVVAELSFSKLAKVIVTIESLKFLSPCLADIDYTYSTFLGAEVDLDCLLFKTICSGAVKIRVYLALGYLGMIDYIMRKLDPSISNLINLEAVKNFETNLKVNNNLSAGSIYFLPYGSNVEKSEKDEKADKNERVDISKSMSLLVEIKKKIETFKSSWEVIASDTTKFVYEPLSKIYKSLSKTIKSASGNEAEIEEIINYGVSFIKKRLISSGGSAYKSLSKDKNFEKIKSDLEGLGKSFEDFGSSFLSSKYSYKEVDSKKIIRPLGRANIYGEVIQSVPFAQGKERGNVVVSIENATVKGLGLIPENTFDEQQIRDSSVACVADMNIIVNLANFDRDGSKLLSTLVSNVKTGGTMMKKLAGWSISKFAPEFGEYFDKNFDTFSKVLNDGIRIRVYMSLSLDSTSEKAIDLLKVKLRQKLQKGEVKMFR